MTARKERSLCGARPGEGFAQGEGKEGKRAKGVLPKLEEEGERLRYELPVAGERGGGPKPSGTPGKKGGKKNQTHGLPAISSWRRKRKKGGRGNGGIIFSPP